MPHATQAYGFEYRLVTGFLKRFQGALDLRGDGACALLEYEDRGEEPGRLELTIYPEGASGRASDHRDRLEGRQASYLFYEPLDAFREYVAFHWARLPREAMERLMGETFVEADFVHSRTGDLRDLPETWWVMF